MDPFAFLSSTLLGSQGSIFSATFLACLFWVVLVKPQRIRHIIMFRIACWIFAISIFLPAVLTWMFNLAKTTGPRGASGSSGALVLMVHPLLIGVGVLLAFESILPVGRTPDEPGQR